MRQQLTLAAVLLGLSLFLPGCFPAPVSPPRELPSDRATDKEQKTLPSPKANPVPPVASDGCIDAVFVQNSTVFALDLGGYQVRPLLPDNEDLKTFWAAFSRNGKGILMLRGSGAASGHAALWVMNPDGTGLAEIGETKGFDLAFPIRDEEFLGLGPGGEFIRVTLAGKTTSWLPEGENRRKPGSDVIPGPDGTLFAYHGLKQILVVRVDATGQQVLGQLPGDRILGFLGTGELVTGDSEQVYIWSQGTSEIRKASLTSWFGWKPSRYSFSAHPSGAWFYVSTTKPAGEVTNLAIETSSFGPMKSPPDSWPRETVLSVPEFSPKGTLIAWPVRRSRGEPIVVLRNGTGETLLQTTGVESLGILFHPTRNVVVTTYSDDNRTFHLTVVDEQGVQHDIPGSVAPSSWKDFGWNPKP